MVATDVASRGIGMYQILPLIPLPPWQPSGNALAALYSCI